MYQIDPSFRKSGSTAKRRSRLRLLRRLLMAGGVVAVCAAMVLGIRELVLWQSTPEVAGTPAEVAAGDADNFSMTQMDVATDAIPPRPDPSVFIDLQRDPMILHFDTTKKTKVEHVAGPPDFLPMRAGRPGPDRLSAIRDQLFVADQQLVTTLPSRREDFALFQAQRSGALADDTDPAIALADKGAEVRVTGDNSWGELISSDSHDAATGVGGTTQDAVYVETEIENTTSVALLLRDDQRSALFEDIIVVLTTERTLKDVLTSKGFDEASAARIVRAAEQQIHVSGPLPPGAIVALRVHQELGVQTLLQMSVYGPDGYIASLARIGAGRFAPSADPWFGDDLLKHSGKLRQITGAAQDVRLLDALYSAAIRNGIATDLVGEMIVLMSQRFDLNRFVAEGDMATILFATDPGPQAKGVGQLLYVGISGPSGDMRCYVTPNPDSSSGFGCFDFDGSAASDAAQGTLGGGLVVPVSGVKTSGFGPRHHPILKQIRNHTGVDWAAPIGTPVVAAKAGKVTVAGQDGAYGNVVYIDHGDGLETRYAHLSKFADKLRPGDTLKAGDLIGYVGSSGRSTGPHLHFEVRVSGTPVNPLSYNGLSTTGQAGSAAVEALVDRIIRIESGGNALARNPDSTAAGLGQFIASTWLRMMQDYRPEFVRKMSTADLLKLRFDPELSREMVRNLARENEAYLRARGHQITPGRLYLAHFLGPAGADRALNTAPTVTVLDAMGDAVVRANSFLQSMNIQDMLAWAERKMHGSSAGQAGAATQTAAEIKVRPPIPPDIKEYREEIDSILSMI